MLVVKGSIHFIHPVATSNIQLNLHHQASSNKMPYGISTIQMKRQSPKQMTYGIRTTQMKQQGSSLRMMVRETGSLERTMVVDCGRRRLGLRETGSLERMMVVDSVWRTAARSSVADSMHGLRYHPIKPGHMAKEMLYTGSVLYRNP